MEGTHVGTCKTAQLDFFTLIVLIRIDFDSVLRVLLPLGLLYWKGKIKINKKHVRKRINNRPQRHQYTILL